MKSGAQCTEATCDDRAGLLETKKAKQRLYGEFTDGTILFILNFYDKFSQLSHFDTDHECGRQRDGQTDKQNHSNIQRAYV